MGKNSARLTAEGRVAPSIPGAGEAGTAAIEETLETKRVVTTFGPNLLDAPTDAGGESTS